MDVREVLDAAQSRLGQLRLEAGRLAEICPPEEFVDAASRIGALEHYKVLSASARAVILRWLQLAPRDVGQLLCMALLSGTVRTLQSGSLQRLPPRTREQQLQHLARITTKTNADADWLDVENDLFQKEFGLATLRLYAAGAQLVDYRCGVPRSVVFRAGIRQSPVVASKMLLLGGFRPFFQIHTHAFNLASFHEEGWRTCYHCCAELYAQHPRVLGMMGSSWFYDPAIERISPRLRYLRDEPLASGGSIFFFESGGDAVANATSTSPTRRALVESGDYSPKSYMLIWGREDQIAWSARNA